MSSFSNLETLITQQPPLSQSAVSNTEFALPQHLTSRLCARPPLVSRPHGWVGPLRCLREYEWSSLLAMHRRVDLDHGNASGLHDRLDSPALGLLSQIAIRRALERSILPLLRHQLAHYRKRAG